MRRLFVAAVAALAMVLSAVPATAAPGTCDPATRGHAFNTQTLSMGNGQVTVDVRYDWDGVSTRETGCDGPLRRVRTTSDDTVSWWVQFENRNGVQKFFEIVAGEQYTWGAQVLANRGFENFSDVEGIALLTAPGN